MFCTFFKNELRTLLCTNKLIEIYKFFLLFRFLNTKKTSSISWKIRSRTQKMTNWAYAQRPKNDPLSIRSMTQKMTLWVYAQWSKKWPFERTLNDPNNDPLSVRSMTQKMTLWAYAQGPKKWPFEHMLKDPKNYPLSVRSIAVWAYAQSLFERTL